ncbi:MAG: Na-translocating system protein MpsB [Planctomycetota bacterium]
MSTASSNLRLQETVRKVGLLLPAQGPITAFVHHNTLHSFEDRPFEQAVVEAGALFGTEPFLPEATFREMLACGRIQYRDLEAAIGRELGSRGSQRVAPDVCRLDIWRVLLRDQIFPAADVRCHWLLEEQGLLHGLLPDLESEARRHLLESVLEPLDHAEGLHLVEKRLVQDLWEACLATTHEAPLRQAKSWPMASLERPSQKNSRWSCELLQTFVASFLDQGLSDWELPHAADGLFTCFLKLHSEGWCPDSRWRVLRQRTKRLLTTMQGAEACLLEALTEKGCKQEDWENYLFCACEGLRGFAGMVFQLEENPQRAPVAAPPCRLLDFLALAVLVEDCAQAIPQQELLEEQDEDFEETQFRRTIPLFQLLQRLGCTGNWLRACSMEERLALVQELEQCNELHRRRLFQEAYERRYRKQVLNALAQHPGPRQDSAAALLDVVLCLDEREESLRRHLEEADPLLRTYGTAGHFGVSLRYRGLGDADWTTLAPPGQPARFWVEEVARDHAQQEERQHARSRRHLGQVRAAADRGSRGLFLGAFLHVVLGIWSTIPLVLAVLAPRWFHRFSKQLSAGWEPHHDTTLHLWQDEESNPTSSAEPTEEGARFDLDSATEVVSGLLLSMGLTHPSRLVLFLGHGSRSLNNPQEAAHDCGACGGGRGGPNARVVARLANDARVRASLIEQGLEIPEETVFVGGWHNTCDDSIVLFDLCDLPDSHRLDLRRLEAALTSARGIDAQERARQFLNQSTQLTPERALAQVEARAHDLAQPRPEYGHATNATLLIGRRARSRGLFLDRRSFLESYDPEQDQDGLQLATVMGTAMTVCAGINLEYYFSFVDPFGYGCGTKLPHNISALLGVMDGAKSDLRNGLPWQMTEIHEPMRLLVIIEAPPERIEAVLAQNAQLSRLVHGRWLQLAALSPHSDEILVMEDGVFRPHHFEPDPLPEVESSLKVFQGRRGPLRPAFIRMDSTTASPDEGKRTVEVLS